MSLCLIRPTLCERDLFLHFVFLLYDLYALLCDFVGYYYSDLLYSLFRSWDVKITKIKQADGTVWASEVARSLNLSAVVWYLSAFVR